MGEYEVQRRLAAILAADVAGYTRLMEEDTDGTVAAWQAAREEVIKPNVADHSGKIVKLTGDRFLVEFSTVQDAVNCAIAMQQGLIASSLDFRMGVNLGDIVDDGEDIHGEGVNVAARLEALAEPGGICISGMVYESVRNRIDMRYDDLGENVVKNVSAPVRVYAVILEEALRPVDDGLGTDTMFDRPAVAVLPFENMSGDSDQEYFADGLTEDIITALSLWRAFPVIARNSTNAYKGTSPDIREVGKDLGARYVIEGSVRRTVDRVRVTAQLIDAQSGHHVWSERYDRELADIFDLQDELSQHIAATVAPELEYTQAPKTRSMKPQNLDAWELVQRGLGEVFELEPDRIMAARDYFNRAIRLDAGYGRAYFGLAWSYHREFWLDPRKFAADAKTRFVDAAERAVALDEYDSEAHAILAMACNWCHEIERSHAEAKRAVELNPNKTHAHQIFGSTLTLMGQPSEGIQSMERAIFLSPRDPRQGVWMWVLALAYLTSKDYENAARWSRQAVQRHPGNPDAHLVLASSLGHLGNLNEAGKALDSYRELLPQKAENPSLIWSHMHAADTEHFLKGLHKAGLAEHPPERKAKLPDKPSIAVLPFANLSGDPEQEYFSDGITEDIITDLSKVSGLFVIARNSAFVYKNKAINVADVCHELGVKFAVEGSVRKAGNRVRITAQLIDGTSGGNLWAERYDRDLTDIFEVQDDVTRQIVDALKVSLSDTEKSLIVGGGTKDIEAHDLFLKGRALIFGPKRDQEMFDQAIALFRRAIELDPNYAGAYAGLAMGYALDYQNHWSATPEASLDQAQRFVDEAISKDDNDPFAHYVAAASTYLLVGPANLTPAVLADELYFEQIERKLIRCDRKAGCHPPLNRRFNAIQN